MSARTTLGNRKLIAAATAAVGAICIWFMVYRWLPPAWRTPGSAQLYLTGVAGALLLFVPLVFALIKRAGRGGDPRAWFDAHVVCSLAGAVLIAIHGAGFLRRPPALLLLCIVVLAALGVWARIRLSHRMAATFAGKPARFAPPDAATRERLRALIAEKRRVLRALDPQADEGVFSPTLSHWLGQPRLALRYQRLANAEMRALGTRAFAGPAQGWWRAVHMLLAWIFVAGVLIHVVTVTFFAGYVADGGPITWWHLTAW